MREEQAMSQDREVLREFSRRTVTIPVEVDRTITHPPVRSSSEEKMKSDTELKEAVLNELKWDPSIDASRISVSIEDGIATLGGEVDSNAEKATALHVASKVLGVRGVADEIKVRLPDSKERTDADLARSAANALAWTAAVPPDRIKATVQNGGLTLQGEVNWQFEKDTAEVAVRSLPGIVSISNEIIVRPGGGAELILALLWIGSLFLIALIARSKGLSFEACFVLYLLNVVTGWAILGVAIRRSNGRVNTEQQDSERRGLTQAPGKPERAMDAYAAFCLSTHQAPYSAADKLDGNPQFHHRSDEALCRKAGQQDDESR